METSNLTLKYKKGFVREDGMVFWAYNRHRKTSEIWVTEERYKIIHQRDLKKNRDNYYKNIEKYRHRDFLNRQKNKERNKASSKAWREENPERCRELKRRWRKENRERFRKTSREYTKNKKETDPLYKLRCNISTLIQNGIRNGGYTKKTKTSEILGCDYEVFKSYIENKFKEGMSWENRSEWHLDHIFPISMATTEEEIIKLNHYTNFQPLWAVQNIKKGNKIPKTK